MSNYYTNRFEDQKCECVYQDTNIKVYRLISIEQAQATTIMTKWCMHIPGKFSTSHTDQLYIVVKILDENKIKIIAGLDLGYGLIRQPNGEYFLNTTPNFKYIKNAIDYMFTDDIISNIKPKGTDNYEIPDIWHVRDINSRIRKQLLKNTSVIKSVYMYSYKR